MRKVVFCALIGVLAVSAGCKKAATPADNNASQPAATSGSTTASTSSSNGLPQACNDYLDKATACYKKAGAAGEAASKAMDQVRTTWAAQTSAAGYDKAALESACKTAAEQFDKMKSMYKCD